MFSWIPISLPVTLKPNHDQLALVSMEIFTRVSFHESEFIGKRSSAHQKWLDRENFRGQLHEEADARGRLQSHWLCPPAPSDVAAEQELIMKHLALTCHSLADASQASKLQKSHLRLEGNE